VLPHLANQNHNQYLRVALVLVYCRHKSEIMESPVLESFRQRYVRPHQQFLENRVLVQIFLDGQQYFSKKVTKCVFLLENSN
jgi:hypothetical protein